MELEPLQTLKTKLKSIEEMIEDNDCFIEYHRGEINERTTANKKLAVDVSELNSLIAHYQDDQRACSITITPSDERGVAFEPLTAPGPHLEKLTFVRFPLKHMNKEPSESSSDDEDDTLSITSADVQIDMHKIAKETEKNKLSIENDDDDEEEKPDSSQRTWVEGDCVSFINYNYVCESYDSMLEGIVLSSCKDSVLVKVENTNKLVNVKSYDCFYRPLKRLMMYKNMDE